MEMAVKGPGEGDYVLNMKRLISFLPPDAVESPVAATALSVRLQKENTPGMHAATTLCFFASVIFLPIIFSCLLETRLPAPFQPPLTSATNRGTGNFILRLNVASRPKQTDSLHLRRCSGAGRSP